MWIRERQNQSDGIWDAVADQRRVEPEHAVAKPLQRSITTGVRCAPARVIAAIHLDDEPRGHCDEITDEAPQRHLSPKPHAERAAADGEPSRCSEGVRAERI